MRTKEEILKDFKKAHNYQRRGELFRELYEWVRSHNEPVFVTAQIPKFVGLDHP